MPHGAPPKSCATRRLRRCLFPTEAYVLLFSPGPGLVVVRIFDIDVVGVVVGIGPGGHRLVVGFLSEAQQNPAKLLWLTKHASMTKL